MNNRFTSRAIKVLEYAQYEAQDLEQNYIGTEHLLLGLLHEREGIAARALHAMGIDFETVRHRVEAVLSELAQQKGGGGNWRTSIVDLLKLLDLDSSLEARKELGQELGVHAGADGSAEQNIALQKAVMRKLAENGGHVPASLRD